MEFLSHHILMNGSWFIPHIIFLWIKKANWSLSQTWRKMMYNLSLIFVSVCILFIRCAELKLGKWQHLHVVKTQQNFLIKSDKYIPGASKLKGYKFHTCFLDSSPCLNGKACPRQHFAEKEPCCLCESSSHSTEVHHTLYLFYQQIPWYPLLEEL